jgi:Rrf2 family iron-sulfur cluster assembly transcriptional regulator
MIYSPTCQHALRALIYLAGRNPGVPVLVRDIAKRSSVPRQSLSKILHGLQRKDLVHSTRGPGGGYRLARPADQIKLLDIIQAVDGVMGVQEVCVLGLDECSDESRCALHDYWKEFRETYSRTVATMTLAEAAETVARKQQTQGVR